MNNTRKPLSLRENVAKSALNSTAVICACSLLGAAAYAVDSGKKESETLAKVVVEASGVSGEATSNPHANPDAPYKVETMSSSKYSRPVAELPQSISIISKESISDSGATDLSDVIKMQPGITLGTGEGGNAFGDRYIIRGFEARNDVFVDGLRDPGVTTREIFATEQLEVSKGPSSSFAGRGTTGGAINIVTKKPTDKNFTKVETSFGTDKKQRYTIDNNIVASDQFALRTNLLFASRDVPGRDGVDEKRRGAAFAAEWKPKSEFKLNADYYHQDADDTPDGGVPWDSVAGKPVKGSLYYGQNGRDYLEASSDILTLGLQYDFDNDLKVENKTRYGVTTNEYLVTIPSLRSNSVPAGTLIGLNTPGVFARATSQNRNQENTYIGNQTNLMLDKIIADTEHSFVFGVEFSREEAENLPFLDSLRSPNAGNPLNPNNNAWLQGGGTLTPDTSRYAELQIDSKSAYVLDTWRINSLWELFGGVRYDTFEYSINSGSTAYSGSTDGKLSNDDGFFNGHLGVVYSPWRNGNIYASYSTSSNPTGEQLDSFTNCAYGGICQDKVTGKFPEPERNKNIELGTKWELMNRNLLLTGAVFQTTKDNVVSAIGSGATATFTQVGEMRVRGVEFGLAGNITEKLSGQVGIALLNAVITKSDDPLEVGADFPNTAQNSANVQLKYQATDEWAVGGTVTYTGEISGGVPKAASNKNTIDANTRLDLMTEYKVTDKAKVQFNVLNVTDVEYYDALYVSAAPFVYVGEGRSAFVTLSYEF